ncbi:MAG: hypothetical protein KGZ82_10635 [Bacteroidales bacterium]|nr:hypothetical protein [Bacteroidales bacterium]
MSEISKVVYTGEVAKLLEPNNSFWIKARRISEAADAGSFEIPQLSTPATAHRGEPKTLPIQVKIATDGKKTGTMYPFWADGILITNESEIVTNYSKRQNHQEQQAAQIRTKIADWAAYQWCPTTSGLIIPTTGAGRASSVEGVTGTRKAATKADMISVAKVLRKSNIFNMPGQMFGLVTEDVYADLLALAEFVDYDKLGVTSKLEKGILGKIANIEIMSRFNGNGHIGVIMTAAGAKLEDVATAATDRPASIFWHEAYVCFGDAPAGVNITPNAPGMNGGTLLEAWKRFGAETVRADEKGTVVLVEAA